MGFRIDLNSIEIRFACYKSTQAVRAFAQMKLSLRPPEAISRLSVIPNPDSSVHEQEYSFSRHTDEDRINRVKDVWHFPLTREMPYIKKSSSTLPKARVYTVQGACTNK
jgi:hypothetical protein